MRSCQSLLQRLEDYWMSLRLSAMPLPAAIDSRLEVSAEPQLGGWSCHDVAGKNGDAHRVNGEGTLVADAGLDLRLDRRGHERVGVD